MDSYTSSSDMSAGMAGAIFGAFFIPCLIIWVIVVIGSWKVYTKAGKPGWASIIPIYNIIVLLEIIGKPIWWIIMLLIPCANIIFGIWMINLLSKSFGKSEGFTIGLIILPFIFYPVLGFGSATYLGPSAKEAQGAKPFNPNDYRDPFNNQNNPPSQNY
ncbi:DUF5684 domain-containing protein [Mucilaginibacter sp. SMC90]|uniref:DUF5684 domain-containing protein n=1 Tax=Mucilaginibacter sp. SMC90 TaxID=2929803 RepID=UPI001FB1C4F1|nr:DUF5684 domain-containing protein [Mucilaginibacter sp. SMC90]UOE50166.1 DUF5684 domain-containing protein [Mucilaginibacter sp. SMC90]